ncbi:MAG TPA: peptidoglycan-binding domain-containing protein [Thermoanaerobaculia bacterium]|jgi:N-acetylmuramoyl-L-alanine amidase
MTTRYEVKEGDCLASIAFEHGFAVDSIWEHPDNAELKKARGDGYTLLPGDLVTIPDLVPKAVPCVTGRTHRFRRRNVPEILRLELYDDEKPRARVAYTVEIDGRKSEGVTTDKGEIAVPIPPNARQGTLVLEDTSETFVLQLGRLAPASHASGALARLVNLGYVETAEQKELGEALLAFQRAAELEETGVLDEATIARLIEEHGS